MVLTAFLGNITEPLEFSFLFIAPKLFIVYAILCGVFAIPLQMLGVSIGYIRGTIFDFGIFGLMYENTHWVNLILLGIVNFIVFYFVFRYAISKFDIKTPGREDEMSDSSLLNNKEYDKVASLVIEALGGKENIKQVENCVSRLRVDVVDQKKLNMDLIRESGALGTFIPSSNHIHV
ncbi:glucose PTS transporter subunit EIIB, partial [Testudinibacter sp. TR-2022]|uniref:glucose PTS transporter subunit EIIB n=1 Tax=Testudinibacter sp. TR-2022 TaxID=2585029 RepID=UPI0022798130